jgi:hypothetical protein
MFTERVRAMSLCISAFIVFFDREKCQGGQPRSSRKEVPYDESWYCPCCCAAVLEIIMIQSYKNVTILQLDLLLME